MLFVLRVDRKPAFISAGLFERDRERLIAVSGLDRMITVKRRYALRGLPTSLMLMIFGGFD